MRYLSQIQSGIDFIEANLQQKIEVSSVARASGLSLWHFQRIFKALTGETVKTYIRSRRLSDSLKKLLDPKKRIIEIAVEAGFESQESFTRAFQDIFHLTPGEFRKIGHRHLFVEKLQFNTDYLKHINANLNLTPEIHEMPSRIFVGMKTTFYGTDSDKNNLGEKLSKIWEQFVPRLQEIPFQVPGVCYGIIQEQTIDSDELDYYSVMEVSQHIEYLPPEMFEIRLPSRKYARFAHRGIEKTLDHTVNYIYSTWLLGSEYRRISCADIETYGPEYNPQSVNSLIYYSIPIFEEKSS